MQSGFPIPAGADPAGGWIGEQFQVPEFYVPNPPPGPVWWFYYKPSGVYVMRSTGKENSLLTTTPLLTDDGSLYFDPFTGEVYYEIL